MQKSKEPKVPMCIYLNPTVHRELKILLLDPKYGKTQYGSLSQLIESLIVEWLDKIRKNEVELNYD